MTAKSDQTHLIQPSKSAQDALQHHHRSTPSRDITQLNQTLDLHPLGTEDFKLLCALSKQSVLKQLLTEGDKILIGRICPIVHQGGYALALNYGTPPLPQTGHHHRPSKDSSQALQELGCLILLIVFSYS